MSNYSQLPQLNKLVNQQQPQFGQFASVREINYLDATIKKANGALLTDTQKKLKANQFCYINISHENYIIGLAIVDLAVASNGFVFVYDKTTNQLTEIRKISPLSAFTNMPTTPNSGTMRFKQLGLRIQVDFSDSAIKLHIKNKQITLSANITPSQQPMCLCTRTGFTGWVYMQKQTALTITGELTVNKKKVALTATNAKAGIDWTLGYMTRETFWNWSSINTLLTKETAVITGDLSDSKTVSLGLNLVCGVNDTSYSENALWLNDEIINMPLTIFDYDQQNIMQPWHIHSNKQLNPTNYVVLSFTPKANYADHTDVKAISSHFNQLIGVYTGYIVTEHARIELNNVWGLAEDHYAKW